MRIETHYDNSQNLSIHGRQVFVLSCETYNIASNTLHYSISKFASEHGLSFVLFDDWSHFKSVGPQTAFKIFQFLCIWYNKIWACYETLMFFWITRNKPIRNCMWSVFLISHSSIEIWPSLYFIKKKWSTNLATNSLTYSAHLLTTYTT